MKVTENLEIKDLCLNFREPQDFLENKENPDQMEKSERKDHEEQMVHEEPSETMVNQEMPAEADPTDQKETM